MEEMRRRREVEILGGKGEEQALRVRHTLRYIAFRFYGGEWGLEVHGAGGWVDGWMNGRQAGMHRGSEAVRPYVCGRATSRPHGGSHWGTHSARPRCGRGVAGFGLESHPGGQIHRGMMGG